jgi:hypothetical protein
MYEVAICQTKEWDWQMSITFVFNTFDEMFSFVRLSLDHDLLVQIRTLEVTE